TRRSVRPRSAHRRGSDGVRSRKPLGPVSTRKPRWSSVAMLPPTRSAASSTTTEVPGAACLSRNATDSPGRPPPTMTTWGMGSVHDPDDLRLAVLDAHQHPAAGLAIPGEDHHEPGLTEELLDLVHLLLVALLAVLGLDLVARYDLQHVGGDAVGVAELV